MWMVVRTVPRTRPSESPTVPESFDRSGTSQDVLPDGATMDQTTRPPPEAISMVARSKGELEANDTCVPDHAPAPGAPSSGGFKKPLKAMASLAAEVLMLAMTLKG